MEQTRPKTKVRDDIDALVDEVIAIAGGDMRTAIRGLILGQHEISAEATVAVSAGYVRRRLH